jgi:para-nitrobenzyl esterase
VFIHGGANIAGYSGDPLYDGAELARRTGTVVISMNYRLGVFGWFLHPSLRTGRDALDDSGNLGLLDIIAALRFVRANIAGFGGLADNVTVMGQSAGAVNAFSLMVSPLTEGLFAKVIALSGALQSKPRDARDDYAARVFASLLDHTGTRAGPGSLARAASPEGDAWRRAFLRRQDTASLITAAAGIPGWGWGTADGTVLPLDPAGAVAAGRLRKLPVIVGFTLEEGKFFVPDAFAVSDAQRVRIMNAFDPDRPDRPDRPDWPDPPDRPGRPGLADLVKRVYASPEAFNARAAQMTDVIHRLVLGTLDQIGPQLDRVHVMRFDWAEQVEPWRTLIGASHAMELPFVFHNFGRHYFSCAFGSANAAGREALSRRMTDSIAAFVRTGDPSTPSLGTTWAPWRRDAPAVFLWTADHP